MMGAILSLQEKQKKRNQRKMSEFFETKRGQKVLNSKRMVRYREKRMEALQPEVDRRLQEEEMQIPDHTQVWFSRYVQHGRLRHWVIMTHGHKYELRSVKNVSEHGKAEQEGNSEFTYSVSNFTIPEEKRKAALADVSVPDVDGYYICLIGWTTQSKEEVDAICKSVFESFGNYHLLWNNCQTFLKSIAQQIIARKAADYDWFLSNTKTRYQKTQDLMPPPVEMLMRMLAQSQAMQANINIQSQNQLNLQMNLQVQNQIQNSINMQMQNQIAIQGGMGGMGA